MLVQVCDTVINTEQVNYVKEYKNEVGEKKTQVVFINTDVIDLPISLKEFAVTVNTWALRRRT